MMQMNNDACTVFCLFFFGKMQLLAIKGLLKCTFHSNREDFSHHTEVAKRLMILRDNYLDLTLTFSIVSRTRKQCGLPSRPPPLNCESHLSIRLNHCSKQACILLYSTIYKTLHRKKIYILYTKAHGYKQCLYTRVHENEIKLSEDKIIISLIIIIINIWSSKFNFDTSNSKIKIQCYLHRCVGVRIF